MDSDGAIVPPQNEGAHADWIEQTRAPGSSLHFLHQSLVSDETDTQILPC